MNQQQRIALFVLLLAGFVTIFDLFVVNVAIVSIQQSLNANLTELTLIIVGYELAFGLLLITGGRLGDIYGKKSLYRTGMAFFTITSLFCALAPTATLLVIARFLQGLSAALLFPQVYASIRLNFNESQAKKAFGYLGMSLGLAAIAGQAFGGWLITLNLFELNWRTIFLVNVPIGILAIALSRFLQEGEKSRVDLDWRGVFLSSMGICCGLLPFLMLPVWGWSTVSSLLFLCGVLMLTLFVRHELRMEKQEKAPLLSMRILRHRSFVIGLWVVMSVYATSSAFPLMLSLLLQNGIGLTPFLSGLVFVPASVGFVISSLLTPHWINRYGERIVFWGAIFYGASYILLLTGLYWFSSNYSVVWLSPILLAIGFTQGMIMTPMLNLVLAKVTSQMVGQASGFTATLQQVGAAIGATAVSVIMQYGLTHFSYQLPFEQLKNAVSLGLVFNFLMAVCAAVLLLKIIGKATMKELPKHP
ncbi:MFS transporter [Providencia vermicola]|uniref:MFS transporter n=1 Tax=Providencia stuartii TaxID=588 RepID=A0AAI9HZF2_PROST|nr:MULTISPECIES: MFS transporter [Providencia]ELR5035414.1 MFS transporter [Providencia stuartii]ELR5141701.1 MFS transporter [Providencia stuartii]ELZ5939182.1 MFS transporter [Providencia stuartii]MCK1144458.1 MFS transporter [Providencia stuartii]WER20484.1 MFS transporter [Providencia stuartii]